MSELKIPSSKSHTIRALYLSLFSFQDSWIENYLDCDDTDTMICAMNSFGVSVKKEANVLKVYACKRFKRPKRPIDVKNSGLVFRFMTAFSALFSYEITIVGDESIQKRRVIKPLVDAIRQGGAKALFLDYPNHIPLRIKGPITQGSFFLDGSDSQPISALLMTLGFLGGVSVIYVTNPQECSWLDVTLDWLKRVGVRVLCYEYKKYVVFPSDKLSSVRATLSADYSSATYPFTYALLKGVPLKITGLAKDDLHPDKAYFDILNKMGAQLDLFTGFSGKKVELIGGRFNINHCIDTLPLLCLVGAFCSSRLSLIGAEICKKKESNRIEAMCSELSKMGVSIKAQSDGCTILPSRLKPAETNSHADHRVAMTLFLANKLSGFTCSIDNLDCISKSYPNFLKDMARL